MTMPLKDVVRLTLAYLALGAMATALVYLATGVPQFGVHLFNVKESSELLVARDLALVPLVVVGFIFSRFLVALLEGIVLTWSIRRSSPDSVVLLLGTSLPVLSEVAAARPYAHSWVGMACAVVLTWPSVPEYVMPARLVFRTAITYLAPALLTGLTLSMWVIIQKRRQRKAA